MSQNTAEPRVVYEGKYQRMLVRGTWEYSERTHAGGLAAIIIAVTPDDEVLFVEQFRVPLQARTIEMPAGLVGDIDAGESIEVSAVRELEEETGLRAEHVEVLGATPGWLRYRLPPRAIRRNERQVCIGQKQVWFLLRLVGDEAVEAAFDVALDRGHRTGAVE